MDKVLRIEFCDPMCGHIVECHHASLKFGVIITDDLVVFEKPDGERRILPRMGHSINVEIHDAD